MTNPFSRICNKLNVIHHKCYNDLVLSKMLLLKEMLDCRREFA